MINIEFRSECTRWPSAASLAIHPTPSTSAPCETIRNETKKLDTRQGICDKNAKCLGNYKTRWTPAQDVEIGPLPGHRIAIHSHIRARPSELSTFCASWVSCLRLQQQ